MATLFLTKVPKIYDGENTTFSKMLLGKLYIYMKKTETTSIFVTCTSINSKWIKELNIRPETLKLVQGTHWN
jgi:hypothetical protein